MKVPDNQCIVKYIFLCFEGVTDPFWVGQPLQIC